MPSCGSGPSCLTVVHCSTVGVTPARSRTTDRIVMKKLFVKLGAATQTDCNKFRSSHIIISRSACIHATDALTYITNTEMMDGWEVINIQSRTAGMSHPPLARCDSNFSLSVPFFVSSCRIFSASSFTPLPSLALLALAKH